MPNKRNRQHLNMLAHAGNAMKKENEMVDEREKLDPEKMSVQDRKMAAIREEEAKPGVHETLPAAGQPDGEPVPKTETETKNISEAVSEAEKDYDPADLSGLGPFPPPTVLPIEEKDEEEEREKDRKAEEKAAEERKKQEDRPGTAALRAAKKANRRNRF